MGTPPINQNLLPVLDPKLIDLLNEYQRQTLLMLTCHHIGTIESFDADTQTVTVTVNYKKTYYQYNQNTQQYEANLVNYPVLQQCPLIILGGGTVNQTFPITAGDQCFLLFNDRDIDNWFSGSNTSPNATSRLHSFADAIAIVGLKNLLNSIQNYDPVRAIVSNGTVSNGINPSNNKITLQSGDTTLNTLLQQLCTQLENLTTALASLTVTGVSTGIVTSGVPSNASTITSIGTNITNIATSLGNLLE